MELNYLVDTNVIIDFFKGNLPESSQLVLANLINNKIKISVISKIELLGFPNASKKEIALLNEFCEEAKIYQLDDAVISATIQLRQKHKIRLPDSIIAATALTNNLQLITHNLSDFKGIPNLILLDSFNI